MLRHIVKLVPSCRAAVSSEAIGGAISLVRGFADDANLKKTALYELHVDNGGNIWGDRPVVRRGGTLIFFQFPSCRQDGPFRWLVDAYPVQGFDHGLDHPLSQGRVGFRRLSHVRHFAQGSCANPYI